MRLQFFLTVAVVALAPSSAVVLKKLASDAFPSSSSNSLALPSYPQSQYGPPPSSPSGGLNLQYGPPQPPPGYSYGPPAPANAPSAANPYALKDNKFKLYSSALSLFDGQCGHWKALSMFLLVVGTVSGLGLLFRAWPASLNLQGLAEQAEEAVTSRLSDPAFLSSVFDQVDDISRVLMNIKDANVDTKEE